MVIDDSRVDCIAHAGARINHDLVDTKHAAFGNLIEGDSRNRRRHVHRTTRRRAVRRHVQQKERRRPSRSEPAGARTCPPPRSDATGKCSATMTTTATLSSDWSRPRARTPPLMRPLRKEPA